MMPVARLDKAHLERLIWLSISHKGLFRESSALERLWLDALEAGTLEIEGYVKYRKLELRKNNEAK